MCVYTDVLQKPALRVETRSEIPGGNTWASNLRTPGPSSTQHLPSTTPHRYASAWSKCWTSYTHVIKSLVSNQVVGLLVAIVSASIVSLCCCNALGNQCSTHPVSAAVH